MPIVPSPFRAPFFLKNAHLQTVWSTITGRHPELRTRREEVTLSDGDFIDLDWAGPDSGPITLVLHGLEGSIDSPYARGVMRAFAALGRRTVLMHFRGCSGRPNRARRAYHSGETQDLNEIVEYLTVQHPASRLSFVGYSLGGNVLLKWLGTESTPPNVDAAVAVSVPFDLDRCAVRLNSGFSRIYQHRFLQTLHAKYAEKHPNDVLHRYRTLREWDNAVTAPLHGFRDATEYYTRSSCGHYLSTIQCPTLIVHAKDDPFMTADTIPTDTHLSPKVTLELSETGGHVGFVDGTLWRPEYYLERRIPQFILLHAPNDTSGGL